MANSNLICTAIGTTHFITLRVMMVSQDVLARVMHNIVTVWSHRRVTVMGAAHVIVILARTDLDAQ